MNEMNEDVYIESVEDAKEAILHAITTEGPEAFAEVGRAINHLAWLRPKQFPTFLDFLIEAAFSPECLKHDGSHYLLGVFEFNWERLKRTQKSLLLKAIEANYDAFTDWMSWFLISELLGEYSANRAAFVVLNRLSRTDNEHARSFVAHGYEHLVSDSGHEGLARKAYVRLLRMRGDPSERVRQEAEISLARLRGVTEAFAKDPLHAEVIWHEPWASFQAGEVVEAVVVDYDSDRLVVEIRGGRDWVPSRELAGVDRSAGSSKIESQLRARVGEHLLLRVLEVDRWRRHVSLSERAIKEEQ